MQSLKSPYILYNQQSMGSTLHNNLLFITYAALLIRQTDNLRIHVFSFLMNTKKDARCRSVPKLLRLNFLISRSELSFQVYHNSVVHAVSMGHIEKVIEIRKFFLNNGKNY